MRRCKRCGEDKPLTAFPALKGEAFLSSVIHGVRKKLGSTIRALRKRLLTDLHDAVEDAYRLSTPIEKADLTTAQQAERLQFEAWLSTQRKPVDKPAPAPAPTSSKKAASKKPKKATSKKSKEPEKDPREEAEKTAALTLLCRLVTIRHMEAIGMFTPAMVTGRLGSKSPHSPERDAMKLAIVFAMLSVDMPGLFGCTGAMRWVPIPAATLREVLDRFEDPELESVWADDTTLGWTFGHWSHVDREVINAKVNRGGKIESHEIACTTQIFTDRYMVEWLLHNSLGLTWLCMCKKHGWTPDAESVLSVLDARRADWRAKRDAGEVALDALMPIEFALEDQWKYFVPQPIPDDMVAKAPESIRAVKLLDPAVGTGNFLLSAFDSFVALYREEARHRGETWSDREIAEAILENNLYGVDIDPRVIPLAAVGLWLKARALAPDARPKHLNLVVPTFAHLANLPPDDPALITLQKALQADLGIPEEATQHLVTSLASADHLGSLFKLEPMVDEALNQGVVVDASVVALPVEEARARLFQRLEAFLAQRAA